LKTVLPCEFQEKLQSSNQPNPKLTLNPSTREIIDTSPALTHLPPEIRQKMLATSVAAEFPTVDLHTLEALYISLYSQQVSEPNKSLHRFTMRPHTRITKAQPTSSSSSAASSDSIGKVTLTALDVRSQLPTLLPTPYDLVIASPERTALPGKSLVAPLARMFDSNSTSGQCSVDAGYRVNFRRKAVAPGCGLWVLGTLADAKVRRDDFSLLSASAGRALESILEVAREEEKVEVGGKGYGQMAML
jgi:lysine/ornithine N-monooxygenase